jgi:hypothetical protein
MLSGKSINVNQEELLVIFNRLTARASAAPPTDFALSRASRRKIKLIAVGWTRWLGGFY